MTRAVVIMTTLALLLAFAAAPVAGRQPAAEQEPVAQEQDEGSQRREGRIDAVVAAAESYLGLPYRIGREGPDIFDCSGLVYRIFADTGQVERIGGARLRAAGYMRWFGARGRFVEDVSLAERGDLVMYDAGKHIGIYLGNDKVISALVEGVTLHHIDGITLDVTGILKVDWTGPGGTPLPHPRATQPPATSAGEPEAPASLIPPLGWLEPLPDDGASAGVPPGEERVDMRTATSRTFQADDGSFITEIYGGAIFYRPQGEGEWLPIELRFMDDGAGRLVASDTPVSVALAASDAADGFLHVAAGDAHLALGVPADSLARGAPVAPALGEDGRFADYDALLRGGGGLRVFPRPDGVRTFLVLPERPRSNEISLNLAGDGLTAAAAGDGSVQLSLAGDPDPLPIGRIPRPLLLDSSDESGEGGGVRAAAASLEVTEAIHGWKLTITIDERALSRVEYPVYVDLSITDFPTAAAASEHTFASSRYPNAVLHAYQRPEAPAHPELWHGRLPGTPHYNEAYLRFADLAETLGAASVESAALRFYPYWQYDLDGPRPTWVSRIAQEWDPRTLTWDLRPAADGELGRFETTAGQWSDIDVTGYVADVLSGTLADYGLRLHADAGGRGSWKRIVSDAGGTAGGLPPRLVVTWRDLRPMAVEAGVDQAGVTLVWSHPALAPDVTRYQLQLSADGFETILASHKARRAGAAETSWLAPAELLEEGVEFAWRVRARYAKGEPWSSWSDAHTFVFGAAQAEARPLE